MNFRYILILNILLSCRFIRAYKFLVIFPYPSGSHSILGKAIVKLLIDARHEVTHITSSPVNISSPNLRTILVDSNCAIIPEDGFVQLNYMMNDGLVDKVLPIWSIFNFWFNFVNTTIYHPNVQKLIQDTNERFDSIIAEWMFNEIYAGFAVLFDCPLIWFSSMNPHPLVLSLIDESTNPSFNHGMFDSDVMTPYTFWERCTELWQQTRMFFIQWWTNKDELAYKEIFSAAVKKRGRTLPPFQVIKYNASLLLGNSHILTGFSIRVPQSYISVGGYHINSTTQTLPEELQNIMDEAKQGVIFFSMGSVLKSRTLPITTRNELLDVFSKLKQTVIWKFESDINYLPKNVHIVKWAPQQSILAHPNCVLFVTHGGLLSITEAVHFGVPIIGIPVLADQGGNVRRAVANGFAKRLELNFDLPKQLQIEIKEILENPRYRQQAKQMSHIYHKRLTSPGTKLVHWVEYVVLTGGAPRLRSPALLSPFYQKYFLDLFAVFLVLLTTVVQISRKIYRRIHIKPQSTIIRLNKKKHK